MATGLDVVSACARTGSDFDWRDSEKEKGFNRTNSHKVLKDCSYHFQPNVPPIP